MKVFGSLTVLLALILLTAPSCGQRSDEPPSILLIVADTLRSDHLGCYGYPRGTSPNIDRLAEEGTLFTRFYTVVPTTLASVTSLMTSLHPKDHKVSRNGFKIGSDLPLLSEVFLDGGFETAAFVSSYCLSSEFGMSRGFSHFDEEMKQGTVLKDNKLIRSAKQVTDNFLSWLDARSEEKSFFALLHYFDPHWPYNPPPKAMARFKARKAERRGEMVSFRQAQKNLRESKGKPGDFEKNLHNLYCAEIFHMDRHIGRILDRLDESGLAKDVLVVFVSDHGETFWEHEDYFNHGLFVYDTTISIPLIFRCPGMIPEEERRDTLISSLDLGPTLCALAGLRAPRGFEGDSFEPVLFGEGGSALSDRPLFSEATWPIHAEEGAERPNLNKAKCVRKGDLKFITVPYLKTRRTELYDLRMDPDEKRNLVRNPEYRDLSMDMESLLMEWAHRFRSGSGTPPAMDQDTLDKLEELGY
jgi:arylsulfatase A-like enzyme